MRQLRILNRVAIETVLGVKQSGWSSWLVISILAVALTIFGGVLQFTYTLKDVVSSWGSQLEISAYLKDDVDPKLVAKQVSQMPNIKLVEIVPREVSWAEMQSNFKVALVNNPLPNTLHIHLYSSDAVEATAARLKLISGIENIRYPLKVARNINQFRHFIEATGVAITAALTTATLMIIGNTIQLVIQSRRREIEILSLMGVNPWYIKAPLVAQGAAYGALSAVAAIGIIWGLHLYMDAYVTGQLLSYIPALPTHLGIGMFQTFMVLAILGIAVGAGGGAWSSEHYIKI